MAVDVEIVIDIVVPVDIRTSPWECLSSSYRSEAMRCWAKREDGLAKGFIADLLPYIKAEEATESPFLIANFRRRWKNRKEADSNRRKDGEVKDPYEILELSRDATAQQIRRKYLKWAVTVHPDTGGNAERFQDVLLAYRILKDDTRRSHYDATGQDAGDERKDETTYIRVPNLEVLREAVFEHPELTWTAGYAEIAGKKGEVQIVYPERYVTQAIFDIDGGRSLSAWLPSQILLMIDEEGREESFDPYQSSGAIMRADKNALMKKTQEKFKEQQSFLSYKGGFRAVEGKTPDPLRDAAFAHAFFEQGRETERGVVLDLGCGDGGASKLFASRGKFGLVFGLDRNKTALLEARSDAESEQVGPEQGFFLIRGDANELPFGDQQVDNVWWGLGWDAVDNPIEVLRGIYRILKAGGRLAISTDSGHGLAKNIQAALHEVGFNETRIYPPRPKVFLNYASKPR